jgi:hypothetical protein
MKTLEYRIPSVSNGGRRGVVIMLKTGREWYQKIKDNITKMAHAKQQKDSTFCNNNSLSNDWF